MKRMPKDLPATLGYFTVDCPSKSHVGFSGPINGQSDEERVRRVYAPDEAKGFDRLIIGHYELVSIEIVEKP